VNCTITIKHSTDQLREPFTYSYVMGSDNDFGRELMAAIYNWRMTNITENLLDYVILIERA
jgi:hypothetical protein